MTFLCVSVASLGAIAMLVLSRRQSPSNTVSTTTVDDCVAFGGFNNAC